MALTPSFSVSQSGTSPGTVTLEDTSSGSDAAISVRRVYVSDSSGTYLTGNSTVDYDTWLLINTSISLDILTQDTACEIRVDWCNSGGTVLYTETNSYCLAQYAKNFLYSIVQSQAQTPGVVQDTSYFSNLAQMWANLRGAINAVEVASDLSASQASLNRCINYENNESFFF